MFNVLDLNETSTEIPFDLINNSKEFLSFIHNGEDVKHSWNKDYITLDAKIEKEDINKCIESTLQYFAKISELKILNESNCILFTKGGKYGFAIIGVRERGL